MKGGSERVNAKPPDKPQVQPLPKGPIVTWFKLDEGRLVRGSNDLNGLEGPLVFTFTMRLPFPLGLKDDGFFFFGVDGEWTNHDAAGKFGDQAVVGIRICNVPISSNDPWPQHANDVLHKLYHFDSPDESSGRAPGDNAYEQWVSLETPNVRLDTEDQRDEGFAFHRCLAVLNRFLQAHHMTYHDVRVRTVTTRNVGAVVFRGAYTFTEQQEWHFIGPMYMHPDTYPDDPNPRDPNETLNELIGTYKQLDIHPFLNSAEWFRRAEYARRYSGDNVDVVVSLQVSMESMLYATWGMLLVDQGKTSAEIADALSSDPKYRPLLVTILPSLLGGRWDTNAVDTPVGKYWHRLYLLRNDIVHRGHRASWPEAEAAYDAYVDFREFINERLWQRRKVFPRTLLAKVGIPGLSRRGWNPRWMEEFIKMERAEPHLFYLPRDIAGRS
jgi:hypothetical protein